MTVATEPIDDGDRGRSVRLRAMVPNAVQSRPHSAAFSYGFALSGSRFAAIVALCIGISFIAFGESTQENPQAIFERAIADFRSGRIAESVAQFDALAKLVPNVAPELWQRGIALYYAGRYKDCQAQFESHRTVNPNDVENAAWHFLCVARAESPEKARNALLPVGPDSRVPMRQIYEMLRGKLSPQDVLAAAGSQPDGQFFAQLYTGLYYEALGNQPLALEHIKAAAADRFASAGGYMHMVAKVHLGVLQRR